MKELWKQKLKSKELWQQKLKTTSYKPGKHILSPTLSIQWGFLEHLARLKESYTPSIRTLGKVLTCHKLSSMEFYTSGSRIYSKRKKLGTNFMRPNTYNETKMMILRPRGAKG